MSITIYTSSTGGNLVSKNFNSMQTMVKILTKQEPKVVFIDIDLDSKKFAEEKSGRKGQWPLLFNGEKFIGNYEDIEYLNEDGELAPLLK
ncbi:hypothetical protein ENUP19_0047G0037 [Entamoeba nuttalli]|uniref:Uncharacterized protein n=1 Tax=Entamoeba nuttalli TaxID=412467 RepID=A0ABQ0DB48_9EUKA